MFDRARDLGGRGFHAGLSTAGDFRKFILRGNVVDLAVGVVIGTAFNAVVQALVKDVITPLIPGNSQNFANSYIMIYQGHKIIWGDLINVIISFLIIALVVYFLVVKPINALEETYSRIRPKQPEAPTKRDCPYCLSEIPLQATRCAFCTSPLPPLPPAGVPAQAPQVR